MCSKPSLSMSKSARRALHNKLRQRHHSPTNCAAPEEVLEPTTAQSVQPLTTDAPTSTAQAQVNAADADVEVGFVRQARRRRVF